MVFSLKPKNLIPPNIDGLKMNSGPRKKPRIFCAYTDKHTPCSARTDAATRLRLTW
jgi:hypothetical protein